MTVFEIVLLANNWLTFILGTVCNVLVLCLCFKERTAEIAQNRWNIALQATLQLIECLNLTLMQLGIHESGQTVVVMMLGYISEIDLTFAYIFYQLFIFLFSLRSFFLPIGFVYRYSVICGKHYLASLFHTRRMIYMSILLITPPLAITVINEQLILCSKIGRPSSLFQSLNQMVDICFALGTSTALAYVIIIFTSFGIFRTLRTGATAEKTKQLQRQLTVVMLLQAFTPLICTAVPLLVFCIIYFGKVHALDYGSLACALLNWQPCLNSIFSLYFVKPFRNQLLRIFHPTISISATEMQDGVTKNTRKPIKTLVVCRNVEESMPGVN